MTSVMCIVGLGWGPATRVTTVAEVVRGNGEPIAFSGRELDVAPTGSIGEERSADLQTGGTLYDSAATARVIGLWIVSPSAAAAVSYAFFSLV